MNFILIAIVICGTVYFVLKKRMKVLLVLYLLVILIYFSFDKVNYVISDTVSLETFKNKDYYIIEKDYAGNYDLQFLSLSGYSNSITDIKTSFEVKEVMSYADYNSYCNKWSIKAKYSDSTKDYIIFSYLDYATSHLEARLAAVEYNDNDVDLYIWDNASGVETPPDIFGLPSGVSAYVLVIPTDKRIDNINIVPVYTNTDYINIVKYDNTPDISIGKIVMYYILHKMKLIL